MNFKTKPHLSDHELANGLRLVIYDGLASQAMTTLTGGAFLVAFALLLGATNFQIGLLAALPTLSNVFQMVSIYLVSKWANRRKIVVLASLVARIMFFLIVLLPFFNLSGHAIAFLIVALAIHHTFASISAGGWASWMRDLIPKEKLGCFFSNRLRLAHTVGVVFSIASALFIDYVRKNHPEQELKSYALLFMLGGIAGLVGVCLLYKTPEPAMQPMQDKLFTLLKVPFKNTNFRRLIMYNASWNFATNLAAPFFTVYLLNWIGLDLILVVGFTILSQLTNIIFLKLWGRYADTYSYKSILGICAPLYLLCILGWTFTTLPDRYILTLPLLVILHIVSGIATAGTGLASSSIGLKLSPKQDAVAFLSVISFTNSISSGLAPILGGWMADFFFSKEFALTVVWKGSAQSISFQALNLQQWDFFFVISFVIGLYALHHLAFIQEEGHVKQKVILKEISLEIRREMKNLSTITGLRPMMYLPLSLYQLLTRKNKPEGYNLENKSAAP